MGSPARRIRHVAKPAGIAITNSSTGSLTFARPDDPGAIAAGTTLFADLLTRPDPNDRGDLSGRVSTVNLDSDFVAADVFLTKVSLVDADGNELSVIFDDAVGVATNGTGIIAALLNNTPIGADESLRISLLNSSGGTLPSSGVAGGTAVYELGINYGQEGSTPS